MWDICIPFMMFLCLNLWPGEACTDSNNANDTNDANDNDARRTKYDCTRLWLINQMSKKASPNASE